MAKSGRVQAMQRQEYGFLEQLIYIAIAVSAGAINALQLAMIGGLTRERGGFESIFISMLASVGGLGLLMGGMVLIGLTAIPYLLAAAFVGSRLGLGVYFAAIITGQMSGSLVVDQIGAFGGDIHPIDISRIAGVALLVVGVVLIRGR